MSINLIETISTKVKSSILSLVMEKQPCAAEGRSLAKKASKAEPTLSVSTKHTLNVPPHHLLFGPQPIATNVAPSTSSQSSTTSDTWQIHEQRILNSRSCLLRQPYLLSDLHRYLINIKPWFNLHNVDVNWKKGQNLFPIVLRLPKKRPSFPIHPQRKEQMRTKQSDAVGIYRDRLMIRKLLVAPDFTESDCFNSIYISNLFEIQSRVA